LRALLLLIEEGKMIAQQQKQIESLTTGLQKVSAQLELSKSAPQTVLNTDSPDWGLFFYCSFEHSFMRAKARETK
jgi:hypothetical protein